MARAKKTTEEKASASTATTALILKNPRITEKAANAQSVNAYVFDVAVGATKSEVAKAFFAQYSIKPVKVNVLTVKPKMVYRRATNTTGFKTRGKKAYVYLPKGKTIEIV